MGAVVAPGRNFTRVDNRVIDDEDLPGAARWVYTLLSRLTPGFRFDEGWLQRKADLARGKLRAALAALEARGLITRRQHNSGRRGFGDTFIYVGDQPLPMEPLAPVEPKPVNVAEQRKHGKTAGRNVDQLSVDATTTFQDHVLQEGGSTSVTRTREAPRPPTPEPGEPMPTYRQPPLMSIVPKTRPASREIERTSPAAVVDITPGVLSAEAIRKERQTIVDEWLAHRERCGAGKPPSRVLDQVDAAVLELICDGIDGWSIRRGLADWTAKGYAPGAIASFVDRAANGRALALAQQPETTRRDRRAAAAIEMGARLQAAADARAAG